MQQSGPLQFHIVIKLYTCSIINFLSKLYRWPMTKFDVAIDLIDLRFICFNCVLIRFFVQIPMNRLQSRRYNFAKYTRCRITALMMHDIIRLGGD